MPPTTVEFYIQLIPRTSIVTYCLTHKRNESFRYEQFSTFSLKQSVTISLLLSFAFVRDIS